MTSTDKSHKIKVNDEAPTYIFKCLIYINLSLNIFYSAFVLNLVINSLIAINTYFLKKITEFLIFVANPHLLISNKLGTLPIIIITRKVWSRGEILQLSYKN